MKRIATFLLALSTIISTIFIFSSCEIVSGILPDSKEDVITIEDGYLVVNGVKTEYKVLIEDDTTDNTDDDGNTDNGENDENIDTTPKVRTTITEEEFKALMATEIYNYTEINTICSTVYDNVTGEIAIDPATGQLVENRMTSIRMSTEYAKMFCDFDGSSNWNVLKDGIWYYVSEYPDGSGKFVGRVNDKERHISLYSWFSYYDYDAFVYNEEKAAYEVLENENKIYIYFENGDMVKIEVTQIDESDEDYTLYMTATVIYTNIGTTVVNVPEFTIEENS